MSDTATQTNPATTSDNGDRKNAPREVIYDIETIEGDLPERQYGGGGGHSPLEENLTKIIEDTTKHSPSPEGKPRWNIVGKYGKPTAATAAKNVLQQRHGRTVNVEGFAFATRRLQGRDADKMGLYVKYEPGAIVPGAKEEHEKAETARLEKLAKAKAEREAAAEAEKSSGGSASGSQTAEDVQRKAEAKRAEKAASEKAAANK